MLGALHSILSDLNKLIAIVVSIRHIIVTISIEVKVNIVQGTHGEEKQA